TYRSSKFLKNRTAQPTTSNREPTAQRSGIVADSTARVNLLNLPRSNIHFPNTAESRAFYKPKKTCQQG
ncbi:MAG: hypothetical protein LBB76_10200, partial [Azoarcus sp.]|nr:hypothetical protein [Azoarcus sp.]